jgi:hypothetical protein
MARANEIVAAARHEVSRGAGQGRVIVEALFAAQSNRATVSPREEWDVHQYGHSHRDRVTIVVDPVETATGTLTFDDVQPISPAPFAKMERIPE